MSNEEKYKKIYSLVSEDAEKVIKKTCAVIPECCGVNKNILEKFFTAPAKHLRAVLVFLLMKNLDIDINSDQILFQSVVELIHNGSLLHDDVIDEATMRRGEISVNQNQGNQMSVILGDYVLVNALKTVSKIPLDINLTTIILDTVSLMCEGEISQQISKFKIPELSDYIDKSYKKTGALFETAIRGAVLISGKDIDFDYSGFMKNFGIAFQIYNDIKNIKNSGDDLKEGIYTAPVIFSKNPDNPFSGIEKAKDLLDTYIDRGVNQIKCLPENKYKSAIAELLELYRYE